MGYEEDERGLERMAVLKEGEKIAVSNEDIGRNNSTEIHSLNNLLEERN